MSLQDIRFGHLPRFEDRRGWFSELWRASTYRDEETGEELRFVQANLSSSATGVLRGLHLHRRQADYWTVLSGRAFVALVDIRAQLADPGAGPSVATRELSAGDFAVVPAGVAHGLLVLEPLLLLYLVTNEYDGTDEAGFAWDDPEAAVPWPAAATPDGRPILSDRDRSNPSLRELLTRLRD